MPKEPTSFNERPFVANAAVAADLARRGDRYAEDGNMNAGIACWRDAIKLWPDHAAPHFALGRELLRNKENVADAIGHLRNAVRLQPNFAEAFNLLGCALREKGDVEAAAAAFAEAVKADPSVPEPHINLGTTYYELGRLNDAVVQHQTAVKLRFDDPKAHFNLAVALLALGRWDKGWSEYEWRRRALTGASDRLDVPQPAWTGWDPAGATLLVVCEQGLGDTLQFIRYVTILAESGAKVVVEAQPQLREILRGVRGVFQVVARGDPLPPFDAHVKLLSLPAILGTRPNTVPFEVPYIHPDPVREARWGRRLLGPGFKVGINWHGSGRADVYGIRSIPLAAFEPLSRIHGVRLFNLQKHTSIDELKGSGEIFPVEAFIDPPLDLDEGAAFTDTAAVIRNLDLVISCDTSVVHLAGALGARTWLALPAASDWRWMRDRDDSPWYPTMRLFRQLRSNNWNEVFDRIAVALNELANPPMSPSATLEPIMAPMSPGEVLDRLAILHIKARRIADERKLRSVRIETTALFAVREASIPHTPELDQLTTDLRRVNEELWQAEDAIRDAEAAANFGPMFVKLARRICRTNDRRSELKRRVNSLLGATTADEKEYRSGSSASP